jgi:UDP-glucose 4-epimerase
MYTLITGCAGYIGSHVAQMLYETNNKLIIIDNLSTGKLSNCKYGIFINADITDINDIENKVFNKYKITNIIHIAGKAFVSESFQKIDEYYSVNVIGTINILNMMVKYNIKNIIFSSSCAVYGNTSVLPITEETILNPISPYGTTKKICEDIIINYGKTTNIKYVLLRYFNVAGNDLSGEVLDNENNLKRIIPTIIFKALKQELVQINGNNYETKDGTCVRNFVHVIDLANAHINSLHYLVSNANNDSLICNIGSNENYSIMDIIKLVENYTNMKIKYVFEQKLNGDPGVVYCKNELARIKLNWYPKYDIHDIIKSYIQLIVSNIKNI